MSVNPVRRHCSDKKIIYTEKTKRRWTNPHITVLLRVQNQETVLVGCKWVAASGSGPSSLADRCMEGECSDCSVSVFS